MQHLLRRVGIAALLSALSLASPTSAFPAPSNKPSEPAHSAPEKERLADAARAWSTGDAPSALAGCLPLAALPEIDETRARCRMIAAAALLRAGEGARAAELLEPALEALGPLRPWGLLLLADARLPADDAAPVLPLLAEARKADPQGPLARRAAALEALHWLGHPERPGAADALARLLREGHGDGPRLRLALARHLVAQEKKEEARTHLLAIWREHPEREEAARAAEFLETLGATPSWSDLRARVERLLSVGQARRALAELGAREAPAEVHFLRGRALMDAGERARAEASFTNYLQTGPTNVAETRILLGRLAARREDLAAAVAHLDEAAKRGAGREAAEAAFLAAFLHYDFGDFAEAVQRFEAYGKAHRHRLDEARWFRGWAHYLQGDFAGAERAFATEVKGPLGPQLLYWRARVLEKLDRAAEAQALYRRVASLGPTDWYGLLASRRLGAPPPALSAKASGPGSLGPAGSRRERLDRAEALYRNGFLSEAGQEFDAAVQGKPSSDFLRAAARLALRAGDPHRAYRLSWRLGGLRSASDLAYPRAFPDALEKASARSGVDPLLLLAIARQESGFSTTVRSPRGAVGLMQLLPATAERLAEGLGGDLDPRRLEDPRTNLGLGATYLAALLERFGDHPCLAVAAYNAGPGAVAGWQKDPLRKELELDEWVEAIPWRETRNYVKVVMGNWATFRALEKGEPPAFPVKLPAPKDGIDF